MSVKLLNGTGTKDIWETDNFLLNLVEVQRDFENGLNRELRKSNGSFFTHKLKTISNILDIIDIDSSLLSKKILEPSCGQGIFLLKLIANIYHKFSSKDFISNFIENSLVFVDVDPGMVDKTIANINKFYHFLFDDSYYGSFNGFAYDFTKKVIKYRDSLFQLECSEHPLKGFLEKVDYVIGNPPYVTLYGRMDRKQSEQQRVYYLTNYKQFPASVKNGKINFIMLFLENSLEFLKHEGVLSFIIDISFFESAFLYTRKFLLENTNILSLDINITDFDVASGQLILKFRKGRAHRDHLVQIQDRKSNQATYIKQTLWSNPGDEYKFRNKQCSNAESIFNKIESKDGKTLKDIYPKKNLRTCVMLLNLEDRFVFIEDDLRNDIKVYPYYQGSKGLKEKYGHLSHDRYFYYDKILQDRINDELKADLEKKGIKNKKRVGFGEIAIYENPKIFIRQSAKEIIATYTEKPGAANNSIYVFSLRDNADGSKKFLKFLCGLLNSKLITFYAQKKNIIRYSNGKQPQIKTSDLYTIRIPIDIELQKEISDFVNKIYLKKELLREYSEKIDVRIFDYYLLTKNEIEFIEASIKSF